MTKPGLPDPSDLDVSDRRVRLALNTLLTGVGVCLIVLGAAVLLRYAGWLS